MYGDLYIGANPQMFKAHIMLKFQRLWEASRICGAGFAGQDQFFRALTSPDPFSGQGPCLQAERLSFVLKMALDREQRFGLLYTV